MIEPVKNLRDKRTGATYDETPYESYTYPQTHPDQQALVAKLLGFTAPDPAKARVLELGCAGGGNILPLAIDFPDAEFFGIDLSPAQIEQANNYKSALNLTNIKFEALDIMDISPKHGKFDFIICHGVFSWVPDFVREKILKICEENLSEHGLACISFNVMPGWSTQRTIREMLIQHTRKVDEQAKKIEQAKILVNLLSQLIPQGTPMQQTMLATHQKFQQPNTDSYVLHEYLEPNNNQFYFTDFVEMLDKHALRYIGDSDITSMNTLNLGPQVDATLKQIHDLTLREQYIDYISNRAFRMAIITRQSSKPAAVNPEVATDLYFTSDLQAQTPPDAKGFIRFQKANTSLAININDPLLQALFKGMFEPRYKAYSFTEMVEIAVKALGEPQRDAIDKALRANLIPYALRNVLQVRLRPSRHTNVVSNKPQAYALSRYQAKFPNPAYIVTANHSFSRLTVFELAVLQYLDGTNSKDQIVEKAAEQLKSASMPIQHTDLTITDPGKIKGILKDNIASILQNIANQGILLA